jgi:hypothetical protein
MTYMLSPGPVHSIVQNEIYALPASRCTIQSAAAVQVSLTTTTTDFTTLSASTTGTEVFAKFVRCTSGNTTICVKKT